MDSQSKNRNIQDPAAMRDYYDRVYYANVSESVTIPAHYRRLAKKFQPWKGKRLLDVACGTGQWLGAAASCGAISAGVDISEKALAVCRKSLPNAELRCASAEQLPFDDRQFDVVSCLGALEHFFDPHTALLEMVRVAKAGAIFILLVPNAGFLPFRFGIYSGTQQADVREEIRSLSEWNALFASAGLAVKYRWRDLHILSSSWILRSSWYEWPVRAAQAIALPFWPVEWQYQVYHLCTTRR